MQVVEAMAIKGRPESVASELQIYHFPLQTWLKNKTLLDEGKNPADLVVEDLCCVRR